MDKIRIGWRAEKKDHRNRRTTLAGLQTGTNIM